MTETVALPDEATLPRWTLRHLRFAVVVDGQRPRTSNGLHSRRLGEKRVPISTKRDPPRTLPHAVDDKWELQIDLHLAGEP